MEVIQKLAATFVFRNCYKILYISLFMVPDIYDVLNYPERGRNKELERALDDMGVQLIPFGTEKIYGVPVLGKGWSSVVFCGFLQKKKVAVKIQRADATRTSLQKEASFLRVTNTYRIGPTLYYEGETFLIIEYLEGSPIRKVPVRREHILSFFHQCHTLDSLHIDHGQIQGGKHLLVGEKCWIIDFEKAGYRRPKNVSALVSELFLKKTKFAREMRAHFQIDLHTLIEATRHYKHDLKIGALLDAIFSRCKR